MSFVTFDRDKLDKLLNLLGNADGDLCFMLPFFESPLGAGTDVQDISARGLHAVNVVAVAAEPAIRGDLLSLRLNGTTEYLTIADNILLTPIAGGVDAPFSAGCAFKLDAVNAAVKSLIAKWDLTTVNAEWQLCLTAAELPALYVMDDSVAASNKGRVDSTAADVTTWYVLIATYDGQGGPTPEAGMRLYRWDGATRNWDGRVDDADDIAAGVYVDMENVAQLDLFIGADFTGAAAGRWFGGEIMMPFYTRRELTEEQARLVALQMVSLMEL